MDPQERYELLTEELKKRYDFLIDNIPDAIYFTIHKENTSSTFMSKRWEDWTGYSPELLIDSPAIWMKTIHPEDLKHVIKAYYGASKKEKDYDIEYRVVQKNTRKIYYLRDHGVFSRDLETNYVRYDGILIDITAQKEAEQRLKVSEEKYRLISENVNDIISILDKNFKLIYINDIQEKISGFSRDEIMGKSPIEFLHPDDIKNSTKIFQATLKTGIGNGEFRLRKKDGSYVWVDVSARKMTSKNGESNIVVVSRDINEKKEVEKKLKESEEKYRSLINNISDVIMEVDLSNKITYASPQISEMFGYHVNEVIGLEISKMIHPNDLQGILKGMKKALKSGDILSAEYRLLHKNGQYTPVFARGTLVNVGGILKFIGVLRDITEQKKVEQDLRNSEEKFREAYNQANFYKDLFMHDINNILQNIKLSTEIFSKYTDDPQKQNETKEVFNIVSDQVERGEKLVSNVRKLSEIEQGQISVHSIDICPILKESVKYIKKTYSEKEINISFNTVSENIFVQANELIQEAFENILINAMIYNENPIIEILIRLSKIEKNESKYVKLEFMDNGIGISDSRKEIIFQKGYSSYKGGKGMGLGLALVKKIIDSYFGEIWVEDRVKGENSKGSNFIILIPEVRVY